MALRERDLIESRLLGALTGAAGPSRDTHELVLRAASCPQACICLGAPESDSLPCREAGCNAVHHCGDGFNRLAEYNPAVQSNCRPHGSSRPPFRSSASPSQGKSKKLPRLRPLDWVDLLRQEAEICPAASAQTDFWETDSPTVAKAPLRSGPPPTTPEPSRHPLEAVDPAMSSPLSPDAPTGCVFKFVAARSPETTPA